MTVSTILTVLASATVIACQAERPNIIFTDVQKSFKDRPCAQHNQGTCANKLQPTENVQLPAKNAAFHTLPPDFTMLALLLLLQRCFHYYPYDNCYLICLLPQSFLYYSSY